MTSAYALVGTDAIIEIDGIEISCKKICSHDIHRAWHISYKNEILKDRYKDGRKRPNPIVPLVIPGYRGA